MKYIKKLNEIGKKDLKIVGGKGANLGEMIKAGLPVPNGFVILTNAYNEFIKQNKIDEKINSLLKNEQDLEKLNEIELKIKDLFINAKFKDNLKQEIAKSYELLNYKSVVVRSSATAEDLPGLSFAGQYNTYLNVNTLVCLEKYIKKCWASLWNARAISYRIKQNIDHNDLAHAIIVQKLINSKKSGILFTANPLNGRRDEILINSSFGLGEAIVSGQVNPDQFIINKKTKQIKQKKIQKKEVMSIRKEKGIELVKISDELKNTNSLTQNELDDLIDLAIKLENYFLEPQDIEWAFDDKIYLV